MFLDQSLGYLSSARREENIAINLPVNVDRQLQRARKAVRAPYNPRQLPRPCQDIPEMLLPSLRSTSRRETTIKAAPGWLGDSGDPDYPSTDSQALTNALTVSWVSLRAVFLPGLS